MATEGPRRKQMKANRPGGSRPEAGFLRHVLLVLLAAFALAELPFAMPEGAVHSSRPLSAFAEERRISEPAERHSAAEPTIASTQDRGAEDPPTIGWSDDTDPAPAIALVWPLPNAPGPSAAGIVAPQRAASLPPCKAVRSRAPPFIA